MGPYGPIYGPIRAHMGPNPDRAPVEILLCVTFVMAFWMHSLSQGTKSIHGMKKLIWGGFGVFRKFLRSKPCTINMELHQKVISRPERAKFYEQSEFGHAQESRICSG